MTPTKERLDADEPLRAFKIMLLVVLMVLFPLEMAVWLLN
jgi:hypothetical protein